ncbi:DUF3304 domain-containing protein [Proteus mirabilis]|nr:DUF3304 domain-containing protein [Proteus mirabilis]MBG2918856.1 DUF3304 domain-containing protein [Proteus mirabilis]MBG2988979.1 DUF3304 domain-containing protein [Proteus mirabilis]MBI6186236.1 DUF3304 domain-containing protein [Proteus mirabilis]MBI6537207.1 DUF3304 domain-containing protein [Proteus mirabilis]
MSNKIKQRVAHGVLAGGLSITLLLTGCVGAFSLAPKPQPLAAGIQGFNHTQYSITGFTINEGYGSIGGTVCCVLLPEQWRPDLVAHIEWEKVDISKLPPPPKFSQVEAFKKWKQIVDSNTSRHEAWVPIPQYAEEVCGVDVHFLPCNEVKITTSCYSYGDPEYPINEPHNMKEPAVCPIK